MARLDPYPQAAEAATPQSHGLLNLNSKLGARRDSPRQKTATDTPGGEMPSNGAGLAAPYAAEHPVDVH